MVNDLKIKVCGMRDHENILAVADLPIDLMGFIFYEKSPRYVTQSSRLPHKKNISRVGVFVNANIDFILDKIEIYQLAYLQLHGDETPEYCSHIQTEAKTIKLIKAFRVNEDFDFTTTKDYEKYCTYFLFDTKAKQYGGTGKKFNWEILTQYTGNTPFLLSGGIGAEDVEAVQNFSHPQFAGIDLNSKFELEPALKDIPKIEDFLNVLKC